MMMTTTTWNVLLLVRSQLQPLSTWLTAYLCEDWSELTVVGFPLLCSGTSPFHRNGKMEVGEMEETSTESRTETISRMICL